MYLCNTHLCITLKTEQLLSNVYNDNYLCQDKNEK